MTLEFETKNILNLGQADCAKGQAHTYVVSDSFGFWLATAKPTKGDYFDGTTNVLGLFKSKQEAIDACTLFEAGRVPAQSRKDSESSF